MSTRRIWYRVLDVEGRTLNVTYLRPTDTILEGPLKFRNLGGDPPQRGRIRPSRSATLKPFIEICAADEEHAADGLPLEFVRFPSIHGERVGFADVGYVWSLLWNTYGCEVGRVRVVKA